MSNPLQPAPFRLEGGPVALRGESDGAGPAIVLLHGLSATRRYVVHGSRHLARRGYRLIGYDARGHGESSPAPDPAAYRYPELVEDLRSVLDRVEAERPVLAGSSMGAGTAVAWALREPDAVSALVLITPPPLTRPEEAPWDRAAEALEREGVEGFVEAVVGDDLPARWGEAARQAARQRMERHRHPEAVADALRAVPRSRFVEDLSELERLDVPALVVGSRDEADPVHPLAVARAFADRLPGAELAVEEEGSSPLAWQGARLSERIGDFLESAGVDPSGSSI